MVAILFAILFPALCSGMTLDDSLPVTSSKGPRYYCNTETFVSDCPDNNVVVLRSASYQQSDQDNCPYDDPDFDQSGSSSNCSVDVISYFEKECFAKWSCNLILAEHESSWAKEFENKDCPIYGTPYVNLSYDCVDVETKACLSCENSEYAKLSQPQGYLASIVTLDYRLSSQCGNSRCPWFIRVAPGQVVNITMVDSDGSNHGGHHRQTHSHKHSLSSLSSDSSSCQKKYVTIKERANPKDFYYCGSKTRVNHLYLSVSNILEIHVNADLMSNVGDQFLIYYEVVGCADIIPPRFSRMKRSGNTCEIDCPGTDLKWTLTCKDTTWEGFDALGTCPPVPGLLEAEPQKSNGGSGSIFNANLFDMPMGVLMALVVASAVILGVLILTTGLVCLKRHEYDTKHKDDPNVYGAACSEFEFREMGAGPTHPALLAKSVPYMNTGAFGVSRSRRASADLLMSGGIPRDNTYAMQEMVRMDSRPLPSLPNAAPLSHGNSWRRNDGPMPYGVVNFYPPGTTQPNRVTVQLHRTDSGMEYSAGATYRARCPPPGGQYPTKYIGPAGTGSRFDPRNTVVRHMAGTYNESQEENHYFVLDSNAGNEDETTLDRGSDQQTMMMTMSGAPFHQPPPAHQNPLRPPVTTNPRLPQPAGNTMMMMAPHRHQHSFGGGDLRCTCDERFPPLRFPPGGNYHPSNPDGYYAPDQVLIDAKAKLAGTADVNKSSGSLNNQL